MKNHTSVGPVLLLLSVCVVACSSRNNRISTVAQSASEISAQLRFKEQKYVPWIANIPGFGGFYLDKEKIVIDLADPTDIGLASELAEDHLTHWLSIPFFDRATDLYIDRTIHVEQVDYSFFELAAWRNLSRDSVLRTPGFISMGISYQ